ncbi:MAG: hypothetical protein AB8C13_08855 [Phycisphaerales bacterium]
MMIESEVVGAITQFGVAGMICGMWLVERRASSVREQQISEAHSKLIGHMDDRSALIEVIRDNTKALSLLEAGQRRVQDVLTMHSSGG